jgi:hypothetical protein
MKSSSLSRSFQNCLLLLIVLCLLAGVSCVPGREDQEWTVSDLRLLDPPDDSASPSTDILAIYNRNIGSDLEIRLDLLDLPLAPDYHLQILLDTSPGGNPWDLILDIPADGHISLTPARSNIIPRIIRDPWLDTITVRFNRLSIPQPFTLKVISYLPGEASPADETASVRSDALPPNQQSSLAFVFWDVFPAATPAQALRRWDGAHTGPLGERHGLKYILDNSELYGIPVALLDLKTPPSMAALSYFGLTPRIQKLANYNLLILPDVAYGEPANRSLAFSRLATIGFGLPASQFVYSPVSNLQLDYLAQFFPLEDSSRLACSGGSRLIPLPAADAIQATQDGPALDVRRDLIATALSNNQFKLVVLGGDLPHSTWGNQVAAASTFAWIAAHPWIHALTAEDLMAFPVKVQEAPLVETPPTIKSVLAELQAAPNNSLTRSAWQTYFMLTTPTSDQQLLALREVYFGQVGELLAAAQWADHPSAQTSCSKDLNYDDQPECVLSNGIFFAILDPVGARLTNLFYFDGALPHQLVGPSSQLIVGLSDSSEWHPELGQAADPGVIPGAFLDDSYSWMLYNLELNPFGITFSSQDRFRIKTYQLLEDSIKIIYHGFGPVSTRIPLLVDPAPFFFNPTGYAGSLAPGSWTWETDRGIRVEVLTGSEFSIQSFTDSLQYISLSEDPNRLYPGGHYLPFPLSVVNIEAGGDFNIQIEAK